MKKLVLVAGLAAVSTAVAVSATAAPTKLKECGTTTTSGHVWLIGVVGVSCADARLVLRHFAPLTVPATTRTAHGMLIYPGGYAEPFMSFWCADLSHQGKKPSDLTCNDRHGKSIQAYVPGFTVKPSKPSRTTPTTTTPHTVTRRK
jgi:hypothetical protein